MRRLPRHRLFAHTLEPLEPRRQLSGAAGAPDELGDVPVLLDGSGGLFFLEGQFGGGITGSDDDLYDFGDAEGTGYGAEAGMDETPDITPLFYPAAISVSDEVSGFNEWDAAWMSDAVAADVQAARGGAGAAGADDDLYDFGKYLPADDQAINDEPGDALSGTPEVIAILPETPPAGSTFAEWPSDKPADESTIAAPSVVVATEPSGPVGSSDDTCFVVLTVPDAETGVIAAATPGAPVPVLSNVATNPSEPAIGGPLDGSFTGDLGVLLV